MNSTLSTKTVLLIASALGLISFGYFLAGPRRIVVTQSTESLAPSTDASPAGRLRDKDPYQVNQVKNTVLKNVLSFHECYQDFLKASPKTTEGKIKMDWQIAPDGQVQNPAVVFSELGNPAIESCLGRKLSSLTFPPTPTGRTTYAFHVFRFKKETPDPKQPQLAMPIIMNR